MYVYIVMMLCWGIFALILSSIETLTKKQKQICSLVFALLSIILIMTLRNISVGTDTESYYFEFLNSEIYLNNKLRPSELGYSYFNSIIYNLNLSFHWYKFIIAFIFTISLAMLYYYYSKKMFLSFYLHITMGTFAISMTGFRQSLAIAFSLIAFIFLMKNKRILFFVFVGIAFTFHNSALILLVLYLIKDIKLSKKTAIIFYFISCFVFIFKGFLKEIVGIISPEKYTDNIFGDAVAQVNPLVIIVAMIIPLACLIFWPSLNKNEHEEKILSILFIISCFNFIVYFLALDISLFERMSYYFITFNTILIPNIIYYIKNKNIKVIAVILCVLLPLIQFILVTPGGSSSIDNYKFFWE